MITWANFVRTAGEAGQVAWRAPGASAAGIVRSGPGAGRDVREWETDILCASEPDGLAAWAGALPRARRRCEAGKRTHGPGQRACLALLAATALLALAAPAQAQTEIWSATLTPPRTRATAPSAATPPRATPRLSAATPPSSPTTTSRSAPLTTPSGLSSWQARVYKSLPPASSPTPTPSPSCWAPPLSLFPAALPSKAGAGRVWPSTGLSWTAGTDVSVRLIARHHARRAHRAGRDRQRAVPDRPRLDRPGQHRRLRHHRLQD